MDAWGIGPAIKQERLQEILLPFLWDELEEFEEDGEDAPLSPCGIPFDCLDCRLCEYLERT